MKIEIKTEEQPVSQPHARTHTTTQGTKPIQAKSKNEAAIRGIAKAKNECDVLANQNVS